MHTAKIYLLMFPIVNCNSLATYITLKTISNREQRIVVSISSIYRQLIHRPKPCHRQCAHKIMISKMAIGDSHALSSRQPGSNQCIIYLPDITITKVGILLATRVIRVEPSNGMLRSVLSPNNPSTYGTSPTTTTAQEKSPLSIVASVGYSSYTNFCFHSQIFFYGLRYARTKSYFSIAATPFYRPSTALISNIISMCSCNEYSFYILRQWREQFYLSLAIFQKNQRLSNSLTCQQPMFLKG